MRPFTAASSSGGSASPEPLDRAGEHERQLAVVGRQVAEQLGLVERRRATSTAAPTSRSATARADEIAVGADGGQRRPVVAVAELLGAAARRCRARRRRPWSPSARPSPSLPSYSEWPSISQSTSASRRSIERRQHVDALGAVVVDLAVDLTRRLDEQRDPVDLLAVGVGDLHPPDVRRRQVGAVVGRHDERACPPSAAATAGGRRARRRACRRRRPACCAAGTPCGRRSRSPARRDR